MNMMKHLFVAVGVYVLKYLFVALGMHMQEYLLIAVGRHMARYVETVFQNYVYSCPRHEQGGPPDQRTEGTIHQYLDFSFLGGLFAGEGGL